MINKQFTPARYHQILKDRGMPEKERKKKIEKLFNVCFPVI